ncbi:PEGA domain-containing protein [Candidatus Saccharibacteria bacterium]|nr:PEGA domain-containing protein [Candidatus Saccharibacteria bacterium]
MDTKYPINKNRWRVVFTNTLMLVATFVITGVLVLIAMGYTFNRNMNIEQTGLVQFISKPSGATVSIDGQEQFAKTRTKATVDPTKHEFKITKAKYDTWTKTVDVDAGHVLWLNYIRLLPLKKQVTLLNKFSTVAATSAAPSGDYMLVLPAADSPTMQLLDLRGDQVKTSELDFASVFSDMKTEGVTHQISLGEWNADNNKLLVTHKFGSQVEYVLLDIKSPKNSINLTTEFKLNFSAIKFATNDGKKMWVLENGNLRKVDVGNLTVSAALVSNVAQFSVPKKDVVLFISTVSDANLVEAGVYKDGDSHASTLYSIPHDENRLVQITGSRYFSEDYAIVLEADKLTILKGDFPSFGRPVNSLSQTKEIKLDFTPERLEISSNGRFVFAIKANKVFNYDLETDRQSTFNLNGEVATAQPLHWLDGYILWSDQDNQLTIYDFDGNNKRDVQAVTTGFSVALTSNDKYIYSFKKDGDIYYLQRLNLVAE